MVKSKKVKNAKKEFISLLCIGIVIIIIITVGFLVFYRPFVNWKKFNCSFENGTLEKGYNGTTVTYHYEIEGVSYSKTLKWVGSSNHEGDGSDYRTIYVNLNNPHDVKRGAFGKTLLIVWICCIGTGSLLIWFAFHQKKSILKQQAKERKSKHLENHKD